MTAMRWTVLALLLPLLFACAGKPLQLGSREHVAYDASDPVDIAVTECGAQVLLFLPFFNNNRAARAYKAIEEKAGDRYIANVRMREQWAYLVFGIVQCTDMVARTYPKLSSNLGVEMDEEGE